MTLRGKVITIEVKCIDILPDDSFDDWVVQDDKGREFGHFPTREEAEIVAAACEKKRWRVGDPFARWQNDPPQFLEAYMNIAELPSRFDPCNGQFGSGSSIMPAGSFSSVADS